MICEVIGKEKLLGICAQKYNSYFLVILNTTFHDKLSHKDLKLVIDYIILLLKDKIIKPVFALKVKTENTHNG